MSDRARVLILVAICGVLTFAFLGSRPLYNVDEGMHSATSKEMVLTGDWITPHHNGKPFYDKTALHNWFVALSFLALGFTEFAARLPAVLLGLGSVLLTFWMGRRMYGSGPGFYGAVVLATSVLVILMSQTIVHDISLLFFVTLAFALFYRGYSDPRGGRKWFLFSYVAFGMAVLAKGPIGLLLPGAVIFLFFAFRRDFRCLLRMSLPWGVLIFAGVAAPWFVAISLANADYVEEFFVKLHFGNFTAKGSMPTHPEPWYYYGMALVGTFMPWSVFLPGAIHRAWQRRGEDESGATLLLLLWAGFYFLFFSAASSKLVTYILPIFPALAILTGRLWHEVATREVPGAAARRWVYGGFLAYVLFPIATIWMLKVDPEWGDTLRHKYGIDPDLAGLPLYAFSLGLLVSGALLWWKMTRAAFAGIGASFGLCMILFILILVPVMNPYQTSREVAMEMDRRVSEGDKLVNFHRIRDTFLFYTDRRVRVLRDTPKKPDRLKRYLDSPERVFVLIAKRHYESKGLTAPILMVQGDDLLISNRDDP